MKERIPTTWWYTVDYERKFLSDNDCFEQLVRRMWESDQVFRSWWYTVDYGDLPHYSDQCIIC